MSQKTKELEKLATYLINSQEGINTVDVLKEKGLPVDTMGAIKGNIDKILSNRFKKRGMSWSTSRTLNLAKIGQLIINGTWDDWWSQDDDVILKEIEPEEKVSLPKEDKYDHTYPIQVLIGPHQDHPCVKKLKELITVH
jgi:hypothetical protein